MTATEKAIATLTRCGAFNNLAALDFQARLTDGERAELAQLHDEHEHYATQGDRFRALLDAVADRSSAAPTNEAE